MIRDGHLSVYDLVLTTRSPLCLGTSKVISKTNYLFDPRYSLLTVLDTTKMFSFLLERGLVDAYEQFVFSGQTNMFRFLVKECGLSDAEIQGISLYRLNTQGALDAGQSLKNIYQITRTPDGQIYIPGSSVKGALRTALLLEPVLNSTPREDEHLTREYSFRENRYLNGIEYVNIPEKDQYRMQNSPASSVAQGIRISDSQPVPNDLVALAAKVDVLPNGECNYLNVLWECIPPGVPLHFKMTLDHSILDHCRFNNRQGITVETIEQAIARFADYFQDNFASRFLMPAGCEDPTYRNRMFLGGNTGYFSKTLSYPYWKERAPEEVSEYLRAKFPLHKHGKAAEGGLSPHTLNFARYDGKLYPMGLCEVSIT